MSDIGRKFTMPDGQQIEVLSVRTKWSDSSSGAKYYCLCSVCSLDKELYPNPFVTTLSQLTQGHTPCGCHKGYSLNEEALTISISRFCSDNQLKLISLDFRGLSKNSYVVVRDTHSSIVSKRIKVTSLLIGGRDCVERFYKNPSEKVITTLNKDFIKGRYIFRDVLTGDYYLHCNHCAKDEYSVSGLCNGVFKTNQRSLSQGHTPCRCSDRCRLTKEQLSFKLTTQCTKEGCKFLHFTNTNKSSANYWRFSWLCHCGIPNSNVLVGNYTSNNRRCSACAKSGFDKNKKTIFYIVRWFNEEFECLKFGITNQENTLIRVKQQAKYSDLNYEILREYKFEDGTHPLRIETKLKRECKDIKFATKELLPHGWCETVGNTKSNLDLITNLITG